MALNKLEKQADGIFHCPTCHGPLQFVDGGAVLVVNGQVDMENTKPKHECHTCGVFYREVMGTGYYDCFPLAIANHPAGVEYSVATAKPAAQPSAQGGTQKKINDALVPLTPDASGVRTCPTCKKSLRFVDGGSVRIVNGQVDMENTKPKYECDACGVFYREMLSSGYYKAYLQTEEDKIDAVPPKEEKKRVIATGDLQPMRLKRDEKGSCDCPRCGARMEYIEGGAVRLVDGKPYMEDVWDHFSCDNCQSVFRRIAGTDYFQWSEK